MSALTEELPEPEEGQNALPGLPAGPSFEGLPVARYRANLSGMSNVPAPGELRHGDRGYARVYFKVTDIDHPPAEKERDEHGQPMIGRLIREHGLTGLELEFETVEDRYGNKVSFVDGKRVTG